MKIRIDRFNGMAPMVGKSKLPPNMAQNAVDCKLWSGDLRPYKKPTDIFVPTKTGPILGFYDLNGYWLHWPTYVNVIESPISSDIYDRIYYTGDTVPKVTNEALTTNGVGTDYPLDWYQLGVPAPENAASLTVTGGSSGSETRSYVYTFVTQWGEEGVPSPAVTVTGFADATSWDLSNMDTAPPNSGNITNAVHNNGIVTVTTDAPHYLRTGEYVDITGVNSMTLLNGNNWKITRVDSTNFAVILTPVNNYTSGGTWSREANINTSSMKKRIYRTVSGVYKFVAEIDASTTTFSDTFTDSQLGESIASTDYDMPPSEMQGIKMMPNGIAVGFVNNEVCFSEPYLPHAWPEKYRINTDNDIVAVETWGMSVVVGTVKYPYRITGVHPSSMSKTRIKRNQACLSAQSMQQLKEGVIYACPDGLMYISSAGAELITNNLLKKDEWKLYNPSSIVAAVHDNRYYAWYKDGGENLDKKGGFVFSPEEQGAEFSLLSSAAIAAWVDYKNDKLYIIQTDTIQEWEAGSTQYTNEWFSKEFILPRHVTLRAAQVHVEILDAVSQSQWLASFTSGVQAVDAGYTNNTLYYDGALGGSYLGKYVLGGDEYYDIVLSLGTAAFITMEIYKDGTLIHSETIDDDKEFRITDTGRGHGWEIKLVSSQIIVKDITIGETMSELP